MSAENALLGNHVSSGGTPSGEEVRLADRIPSGKPKSVVPSSRVIECSIPAKSAASCMSFYPGGVVSRIATGSSPAWLSFRPKATYDNWSSRREISSQRCLLAVGLTAFSGTLYLVSSMFFLWIIVGLRSTIPVRGDYGGFPLPATLMRVAPFQAAAVTKPMTATQLGFFSPSAPGDDNEEDSEIGDPKEPRLWSFHTTPYLLLSFGYLVCSAARVSAWYKRWGYRDIETLPFQCCLVVGNVCSAVFTLYTLTQEPDQTSISLDLSPPAPLDATPPTSAWLLGPLTAHIALNATTLFGRPANPPSWASWVVTLFKPMVYFGSFTRILGAAGLIAVAYGGQLSRFSDPAKHRHQLSASICSLLSALTFTMAVLQPLWSLSSTGFVLALHGALLFLSSFAASASALWEVIGSCCTTSSVPNLLPDEEGKYTLLDHLYPGCRRIASSG